MDLLDATLLCCLFLVVWLSMAFEVALEDTPEMPVLEFLVFTVVAVSVLVSAYALILTRTIAPQERPAARWISWVVSRARPARAQGAGARVQSTAAQIERLAGEIDREKGAAPPPPRAGGPRRRRATPARARDASVVRRRAPPASTRRVMEMEEDGAAQETRGRRRHGGGRDTAE